MLEKAKINSSTLFGPFPWQCLQAKQFSKWTVRDCAGKCPRILL